MLRKMLKGSYRQKPGTFLCELSNEDVLRQCDTENIHQFIARQQHNLIAHVIREENNKMTKRFLFNDDSRKETGCCVTRCLYKTVLENKKITPDTFNKNILTEYVQIWPRYFDPPIFNVI